MLFAKAFITSFKYCNAKTNTYLLKTFTKWCNAHLVKKFGSDGAITNVEVDFESGVKLMQLVNALYGVAFPSKYTKTPKMRPQKLDNTEQAFKMLDEAKVRTNFLKTHRKSLFQFGILTNLQIWSIRI
jgi:hypothetical protein